jgi:hypothetical protein
MAQSIGSLIFGFTIYTPTSFFADTGDNRIV